MSDVPKFDVSQDDAQAGPPSPSMAVDGAEEETVEGIVVLGEQDALLRSPTASPVRALAPTVQAAAVAAGGFVAGAAIVGLVHRHRSGTLERRRAAKRARRRSSGPAAELLQIVGSRSLLVDVHLLGGSAGGGR